MEASIRVVAFLVLGAIRRALIRGFDSNGTSPIYSKNVASHFSQQHLKIQGRRQVVANLWHWPWQAFSFLAETTKKHLLYFQM
jgi:hypothetical protein